MPHDNRRNWGTSARHLSQSAPKAGLAGTIGQRVRLYFFESFSIPGECDETRIQRPLMDVIGAQEDSTAGLNPIRFSLEFIGLDQRLWSDSLEHFPIAGRLAAWAEGYLAKRASA